MLFINLPLGKVEVALMVLKPENWLPGKILWKAITVNIAAFSFCEH
jgi:hypothetical protein